MLQILSLTFLMEIGMISGNYAVDYNLYTIPENATYVEIGAEAEMWLLFINGSVETQQVFNRINTFYPEFSPYRARYKFGAGLRYEGFEIGWKHMCDHPVISNIVPSRITGGYNKIYAKAEIDL